MTAPRHYDAWADPRETHEDRDPFGPGTEVLTCDAATDGDDCNEDEDRRDDA